MTTTARPAPRFAVGDFAYNYLRRNNARILAVVWDESLRNWRGGWRYNIAGLSDPDLQPARDGMPYVEHVEVRPGCWAQVED